jgi:hypothetical protein
MTNPGENAAFANGYDTARSEVRAQANEVIRQLAHINGSLTTLIAQYENLRLSVLAIAFPAKPDGATDVNQDRE